MNLNSFSKNLFFTAFLGFCLFSSCRTPSGPQGPEPVPSPAPSPEIPQRTPETREDSQRPDFGNIIINRDLPDFAFFPAQDFSYYAAPGVGNLAEHQEYVLILSDSQRLVLSEAFQAAYIDGLLRNQSLDGILGGDQVHFWPDNNPVSWVQNWQTSEPMPNSWGLPSIILAVHNMKITGETGQARVFTVQGPILDFYGMSLGIGGANGNTGYGSPRGEEFFYNNGIAQRFDLGVIIIDESGTGRFIPEVPPSEDAGTPDYIGIFPEETGNDEIQKAFLGAWMLSLDRNISGSSQAMIPDGPGQYIAVTGGSRLLGFPAEDQGIKGLYLQTFNGREAVLLLVDSPGLPLHARFLGYPFLDILLVSEQYNIEGGETVRPQNISFNGGDDFARRLMRGLAMFGVPLSDHVPQKTGDGIWKNAQRFSRGWIVDTGNLED